MSVSGSQPECNTCRQSRAEAAAQKISDYQAKEKAKMAVSEIITIIIVLQN